MTENNNRRNPKLAMMFQVLGVVVVLYWLAGIIRDYVKGGPDAPSLAVLIAGCVVLGGGGLLVAWLTWKTWKMEKERQENEDE